MSKSRENARAARFQRHTHRNAVDTLGRCNLNKRGGAGKAKVIRKAATPEQLAFRDLVALGYEAEEARRLAGLPPLR